LNLIRVMPAKGQDKMQTSLFLAKLIGPALLLIGLGVLTHRGHYRAVVAEVIASRALFYMISAIGLVAGLAIVLVHNVWTLDWRVLITLFGWINVVRSALSVVLPSQAMALASRKVASDNTVIAASVTALVLGAVFCFYGYVR
jgi:hypothetical protein